MIAQCMVRNGRYVNRERRYNPENPTTKNPQHSLKQCRQSVGHQANSKSMDWQAPLTLQRSAIRSCSLYLTIQQLDNLHPSPHLILEPKYPRFHARGFGLHQQINTLRIGLSGNENRINQIFVAVFPWAWNCFEDQEGCICGESKCRSAFLVSRFTRTY